MRLGLRIVPQKTDKASFLDEAQAALHIDDRIDLCDHINQVNSRINMVLVTKPSKRLNDGIIARIGSSILCGILWKQFLTELSG